ncbi:MAG: outer membrane beta-barrel protein [Bdellovibrionales bacterium]
MRYQGFLATVLSLSVLILSPASLAATKKTAGKKTSTKMKRAQPVSQERSHYLITQPSTSGSGQSALSTDSVVEEKSGISIEPKLGFVLMTIRGGDLNRGNDSEHKVQYNAEPGHSAGLGLAVPLSTRADLQTGLHFIRTNFKSNVRRSFESSSDSTYTSRSYSELELEQLALPLIGQFCFRGCRSSGFFISGGVIPTYLLGGRWRLHYKSTYISSTSSSSSDEKDSSRISDADWTGLNMFGQVGAGYRVNFNRTVGMVFDANYVHGLFDLVPGIKIYQHGLWTGVNLSFSL